MVQYGRDVEAVEAWVRKGLSEGWCKPVPGENGAFRRKFKAALAFDCEDPPTIEVWGRYNRRCEQTTAIFVDVETRCRKCAACLDTKARYWTARAMDEFIASEGTYMATLTLRPEEQYMFQARLAMPLFRANGKLLREKVGLWTSLAPATRFRHLAREIGYEITNMLKRIRKERGPFRYLIVAERHMGNPNSAVYGLPHFHVLLHEVTANALVKPDEWQHHSGWCEANCKHTSGNPLRHKAGELHDHAFVRSQWPHGYTKVVRCMDVKSAVYVCKYVSKDPMARVRASIGYGKNNTVADDAGRAAYGEVMRPFRHGTA